MPKKLLSRDNGVERLFCFFFSFEKQMRCDMNGKPPLVKIAQKVILVLLGVALCLAAFYGYHWHRA